jgi:hypothetical protein
MHMHACMSLPHFRYTRKKKTPTCAVGRNSIWQRFNGKGAASVHVDPPLQAQRIIPMGSAIVLGSLRSHGPI